MKNLLVKGVCGLGNRMLALTKAGQICDKHDIRMKVCWRDKMYSSDGTNAFDRFFSVKTKYRAERNAMRGTIYPIAWKGKTSEPFDLLADWQGRSLLHPDESIVGVSERHDISVIAPRPNTRRGGEPDYQTAVEILKLRKKLRKIITVKPEAIAVAGKFTMAKFAANTLGVHIRHTAPTKRKTSYDDLFEKIEGVLQARPDTRIMLCCDHRDPIDAIATRYAERLILMPKWMPKGTPEGWRTEKMALHNPLTRDEQHDQGVVYEEAVKEMIALASCRTIIYQHNSSFGACAAVLSNAPKANIIPWGEETNDTNENYGWHKTK
jgi:hypothetical protein